MKQLKLNFCFKFLLYVLYVDTKFANPTYFINKRIISENI